jgi:hypothetical protein
MPLLLSRGFHRLLMGFFGPLESFVGIFHCLLGMFVSGLVVFFSVMRGGGAVRVRGEFMEFGSSLVRLVWHGYSSFPMASPSWNKFILQTAQLRTLARHPPQPER